VGEMVLEIPRIPNQTESKKLIEKPKTRRL
jgi:hypothetical protein